MTDATPLITTDLDVDADGLQRGVLRVPHSHDRSAYGFIPIPIVVARHGQGPTVLLTGGVHGDEYEGPIALIRLIRELQIDALQGRLIIIPTLNAPAVQAATRTSPIDRINLNRTFPGDRNGTPTEMIADYVERVLLPLADYAFDFHAGGSSLDYLPTLFTAPPRTDREQRQIDALVAAFAPPRLLYMESLENDRLISAAARRHNVPFLTGEFGGGATVNREGLAVLERGLAGLLDGLGVLPGRTPRPPAAPARRLEAAARHYLYAPRPGLFEPHFSLGDEVHAGQLAGVIHDTVQPWLDPVPVSFGADGLVLCIRTFALVVAGDCLGHLGSDVG
ncbi:MAG TPA: succinylglutamate desuccinylase/aspartoacylase family protein [Vicinamibacterales bacterium]|nr:succinylglutamate desuccinylase/aspartoacylase family protein [Vicinamibacterales bacterium]